MKRILALCLAFLLILGVLPASVLAESSAPAFVLTGGMAGPGETVQVALSTKNNPGIVSLKVLVEYDSNVLSLTSVEEKEFSGVSFGPLTKNPIAVNWMNSLEPNNTTNGVVAVLTFTVNPNATAGDTTITATYNPNDVFDFDMNNVAFNVENGVVTVGCPHKETTTISAVGSTCVLQGHGAYTYCNNCGDVLEGSDELLPFGDHNFTATVVADEYKVSDATCVEPAVYLYSCALCGHAGETTFTFGDVDKTNHVGGTVVVGKVDPTYDDPGYTGDICCASCGDVLEQGSAMDQLTKEDGLVKDGDVYRYLVNGVAQGGWFEINGKWHYFHYDTLAAKEGSYRVGDVTFTFDETGKTEGVWATTLYGSRYYYGPDFYSDGWATINGNRYYFAEGYRFEGIRLVLDGTRRWYNFGKDGICQEETLAEGFYQDADKGMGYVVNGVGVVGLYEVNGDTYYFSEPYGYAAKGNFEDFVIGDDYKVFTGVMEQDGGYYYYKNGKPLMAGLVEVDGAYYFAQDIYGTCVTGKAFVWKGNGILPEDTYYFGDDGKMLDGIVERDGNYYYYETGKPRMAGLVQVDGAYYFVENADGLCVTGHNYVWMGNGLLPESEYEFGDDARMLDGIVERDGNYYYYETGKSKMAGLVQVDGAYYFAENADGLCVTGHNYVWMGNGLLPESEYEFGDDARMLDGIVERDGNYYYYETGKSKMAGLVEVDGAYYFAKDAYGTCVTGKYYVWMGNGLLPDDTYYFGDDGRMLDGIVERDGNYYYYETGKPRMAGLVEVDGAYYFAKDADGTCVTGEYYVWMGNGLLPDDTYYFGDDGRMLDGIVERDGNYYYYETGKPRMAGLVEVDGAYYFAKDANGTCVTGEYYVWMGNDLLPDDTYFFGDDGKMLDGFVTTEDGIVYYETGKHGKVGLNYIDGNYYFIDYFGKVWTNGTYYVWEPNGLTVPMSYTFDELGSRIVL